jgi:hypothetical protein
MHAVPFCSTRQQSLFGTVASSSTFSFFLSLSNSFLENSFTREAPEGRIHFFYRGEAKKSVAPTTP